MTQTQKFKAEGVMPACLLPFQEDFSIDFEMLRRHVSHVSKVDGVQGIVINAHASEISSCGFEEQVAILNETLAAAGSTPIINVVYPEGSFDAVAYWKAILNASQPSVALPP